MSIILLSVYAGIIGTGLGGVLTAVFESRSDKNVSILLSFAGGVMTSIVFFELIPDAAMHAGTFAIILGSAAGVAMIMALNYIIDVYSATRQDDSKFHDTFKDFYHEGDVIGSDSGMMKAGILMFLVIGLHNIPEGLAIGAAGQHDAALGLTLALVIGFHNIPEGMAVAAPLISGGINKWKAVLMTLLAGVPTVFGAVAGVLIGAISELAIAISFSIAAGAMLYAVFGELLPQSMSISKDRGPTIALLIGIAVGYVMTFA